MNLQIVVCAPLVSQKPCFRLLQKGSLFLLLQKIERSLFSPFVILLSYEIFLSCLYFRDTSKGVS